VAVKAIRAELAENADFRVRFAREVTAARQVSGFFTAAVVDADLDGPVPWLATSYVPGSSLADAVSQSGPLPPAQVRELAAGLAEGLVAIHAAGVVHRDLKPSNVILAEDGPRILDFGISRAMEASALTQTGTVVGSPGFMSPEQAEGGEVGPPSDVFSLGAVLAFAATGEGPFGAGSTAALLYRVVHNPPGTTGIPAEIRPLIERCLDKDPHHRPTAAQLLAEVSPGRPGQGPAPAPSRRQEPAGVTSPPVPPASPAQPATGSGRELFTHAATDRAVIQQPLTESTSWPAAATPPPTPPPPGSQPTQPQPRRSRRTWLIAGAAAVLLVGAAGAAAGTFAALRSVPGTRQASAHTQSSHPARPSPPGTPTARTSPSSTQLPGTATTATLGTYLAQSAAVRPTIQAAIDGVATCSQSPASGQATLQQAINTRQHIITGLQSLSPPGSHTARS
jgi:serine/threonine protein kinase